MGDIRGSYVIPKKKFWQGEIPFPYFHMSNTNTIDPNQEYYFLNGDTPPVWLINDILQDNLVEVQTTFYFPKFKNGDYKAMSPDDLTPFVVKLRSNESNQTGSLGTYDEGRVGEIVFFAPYDTDDQLFEVQDKLSGEESVYNIHDLEFIDVSDVKEQARQARVFQRVSKQGPFPTTVPNVIDQIVLSKLSGMPESYTPQKTINILKESIEGPKHMYNLALKQAPLPHGPSEKNFMGGARDHNEERNWFDWNEARRADREWRGLNNNNNNFNDNNNWQAQQNMDEWRQAMLNQQQLDQEQGENNYTNYKNIANAMDQEEILREVSKKGTVGHLPVPTNTQRIIHSMLTGVPEAVGPSLRANNTRTIENVGKVYLEEKLSRPHGRPGAGIPNPPPVPVAVPVPAYQSALNVGPLPHGPSEENFMGGKRKQRKSRGKIGTQMARRGTRRSSRGIFSRLYSPIGHLFAAGKESVGAVTNTAKGVVGEGIHGLDKIGRSVSKHANMAVKDVLTRKGGKRRARGTRKSRKAKRSTRRR